MLTAIILSHLLATRISNLISGVYRFELTVSANNSAHKDTCTVTVGAISSNPNEIIFENQNWGSEGLNGTLLWGSAIVIKNVYQFLPVGSVFKTYIKRDSSTIWEELVMSNNNSPYDFAIMNGNLSIWSTYEETDTPAIKFKY